MTTNTTLPSDELVTAALEELITDTQNLLDAALKTTPRDADAKEEIAYWKRQRNAFVNAQSDWVEQGIRPTPTPSGYLFPSSSRPGSLRHRAWRIGGVWACSCEAGERGLFHRHTALINVLERALELATLEAAAGGGNDDTARAAIIAERVEATDQFLAEARAKLGRRITEARGTSQWAA